MLRKKRKALQRKRSAKRRKNKKHFTTQKHCALA